MVVLAVLIPPLMLGVLLMLGRYEDLVLGRCEDLVLPAQRPEPGDPAGRTPTV